MWSFFYLINKKAHLEFFIWSPSTDGCAVFSPSQSNLHQHLNLYFLAKRSISLICTCGKCSEHLGLFVVACVIFIQTCIKLMDLDLCLRGSAPVDVLGPECVPEQGPHIREVCSKALFGPRWEQQTWLVCCRNSIFTSFQFQRGRESSSCRLVGMFLWSAASVHGFTQSNFWFQSIWKCQMSLYLFKWSDWNTGMCHGNELFRQIFTYAAGNKRRKTKAMHARIILSSVQKQIYSHNVESLDWEQLLGVCPISARISIFLSHCSSEADAFMPCYKSCT